MSNSKNNWQTKYRALVTERPVAMLFLGLVFTIICGLGLGGLSQNPDNRIFFSEDDPNLVALEKLENTYTKNDNLFILVAPKKGNVFDPNVLEVIRDLTKDLWQTPASSKVDSITNFQWTRADGDDIIIGDLVPEGAISKAVALNAKSVALDEPLILNSLVSSDAKFTGINITFIKPDDSVEAGNTVVEIMSHIRPIQKKPRREISRY